MHKNIKVSGVFACVKVCEKPFVPPIPSRLRAHVGLSSDHPITFPGARVPVRDEYHFSAPPKRGDRHAIPFENSVPFGYVPRPASASRALFICVSSMSPWRSDYIFIRVFAETGV